MLNMRRIKIALCTDMPSIRVLPALQILPDTNCPHGTSCSHMQHPDADVQEPASNYEATNGNQISFRNDLRSTIYLPDQYENQFCLQAQSENCLFSHYQRPV